MLRLSWSGCTFVVIVVMIGLATSLPTSSVRAQVSPPTRVGERVPVLEGVGLDARPLRIDFSSMVRPAVVYVISPNSPFCVRNEANFATLLNRRAGDFTFFMVSGKDEGLVDYVEGLKARWQGKPVAVVGGISPETKRSWRIGGYPHTLVIESGVITLDVPGAYDGDREGVIERYFKVELPGLLPSPPPKKAQGGGAGAWTVRGQVAAEAGPLTVL